VADLWSGSGGPAELRPATNWVHYTTSCIAQSNAPEDGQNNCPKHGELIGIINKQLLLHLVGCLLYYEHFYLYPKVLHHFAVCNKYSHLFLVLLNHYNIYSVSIKISNTNTLNKASHTTENPQVVNKLMFNYYKTQPILSNSLALVSKLK
jgi:hypothetical protein